MSFERGQDQCADCGMPVPNQLAGESLSDRASCPNCGSIKREMFATATACVSTNATASAQLIISWQEVDRLVDKAEYGAALLVAAINVQFIRRIARASAPTEVRHSEKPAASETLVREITDVRNKIAHERGYFALLTQLKDPTWPETRIRQVLQSAKEFCHGNAP